MTKYQITNPQGKTKTYSSKRAAEEAADALPGDITVEPVEPEADGGDYAQAATEHAEATVEGEAYTPPQPDEARENEPVAVERDAKALDQLGEELGTDPLEILPEHMLDYVDGTPTLNKRGLSMLAYQFDVSTIDREIVASPHETDWTCAIVETTVENGEGNTFFGTGTAHVDRGDEKGVLLEMAETRSYKRAVSFATGTGIVSYQELSSEIEGQ